MWQMQIRLLPHMTEHDRTKVVEQLTEMQRPSVREPSVYEQCENPRDRMRLIGSALDRFGLGWLRDHPAECRWLTAQRVSITDCLNEFRTYHERESQFAGFRPAKRKRKEAVAP